MEYKAMADVMNMEYKTLTSYGADMISNLETIEKMKRGIAICEDCNKETWFKEILEYIYDPKHEGDYWYKQEPKLTDQGKETSRALREIEIARGNEINHEWLELTYRKIYSSEFENKLWKYVPVEE